MIQGYFSIWDLRKSKLAHQLFTASNNQESISEPIQYALYTAKIHEGNVLKASFIASYPNFIVTCGSDGSVMLLNLAPLELNSAYMGNFLFYRFHSFFSFLYIF